MPILCSLTRAASLGLRGPHRSCGVGEGGQQAQHTLEMVPLSWLGRPQLPIAVLQQKGMQVVCRGDRGKSLVAPLLYLGHCLRRAMLQQTRQDS